MEKTKDKLKLRRWCIRRLVQGWPVSNVADHAQTPQRTVYAWWNRFQWNGWVGLKQPPSQYFKLLYFDTLTHDQRTLEYLVSSVGCDRMLLGSDYPWDMADPDPVGRVQRLETISESDKERILWKNAAELFKLD